MAKILHQGTQTDLPPAGDARDEELKRRDDALAEAGEDLGIEGGTGPLPKVENELAQYFNELDVPNADPSFMYCWVYSGQQGRMIRMKLAEGWEVVQGDAPEAPALKGMGADTTRRLGDVILMRMRKDKYLVLQRREKAKREAQQAGVTSGLQELGEKAGVKVTVGANVDPRIMKTMHSRAVARQIAGKQTDQMLREGRMPGMPAPGR